MQSVSSRIWTRVAVFISYDDNHYNTGKDTVIGWNFFLEQHSSDVERNEFEKLWVEITDSPILRIFTANIPSNVRL